MLPSKGRRNIVIDGVTWHYIVQGSVEVIANNPETGEIIKWYRDLKPKWQTQITPKLVENIIRTKGNPEEWVYNPPKKYITTTLPYANSVPHIGHAFEFIIGDALARYFRGRLGDRNVHFNIGLDEHGKKIHDTALASGKPVKEYLDDLNGKWREFCSLFNIEYNSFYRTSHSLHYSRVSKFWEDCKRKGLIYKKTYVGNYCVGCESFKLEKDLEDGKCPDHANLDIQQVEEENYFFALSKFRKELLNWFDSEIYLRPFPKKDELHNVLDDLQDISISRKKESVPWGIPVPGDHTQVIYVWFEALLNYIFIIGYDDDKEEFEQYWKDSVQIFGPDNLKFQAAIFQGLLSAAEVKHTKVLLCHGTILDKHGKKMSKTVGNVIDPIDQLNKYGVDAVRYYALAGLQVYGNSGWDEEQLVKLYNAHLADNYGNLLVRVVHLTNLKGAETESGYYTGSEFHDKANVNLFKIHFDTVRDLWEHYDVTAALHKLNDTLKQANQYIQEQEPWKKSPEEAAECLATLFWVLEQATLFYIPVIPQKAREALNSLYSCQKTIVFPKLEFKQVVSENA